MADYTGSVSLPETQGKAAGEIVVTGGTQWRYTRAQGSETHQHLIHLQRKKTLINLVVTPGDQHALLPRLLTFNYTKPERSLGPVNTNSIRSAGACIFRMKGIFGVV